MSRVAEGYFRMETRSALDIEGKHVIIQGPSPDLRPARTFCAFLRVPIGPYLLSLDYQLGNLIPSGLSRGLTCLARCSRVTVRDPSLSGLMAANGPAVRSGRTPTVRFQVSRMASSPWPRCSICLSVAALAWHLAAHVAVMVAVIDCQLGVMAFA